MVDERGALTALIQGVHNMVQASYELVDNSVVADATEVHIHCIGQDGNSRVIDSVVFADNGKGMSPQELQEAIRTASLKHNRKDTDISHFGVGLKAGSRTLGNSLTAISRSEDGDLSLAYINWKQLLEGDGKYLSPLDTAPPEALEQWNKYAVDKDASGTVVIIREPEDTELRNKSPSSFIGSLRRENDSLAMRYNKWINSGNLVIKTKNGKTGEFTRLESEDPLAPKNNEYTRLTHPQTVLWKPKNGTPESVSFDIAVTQVSKGSKKTCGVYVYVGETLLARDSNTWFGMYEGDTSHSYRWGLRAEIQFHSKAEFFKVAQFSAAKHNLKVRDERISKHLQNHSDFGVVIKKAMRDAEEERRQQKLIETQEEIVKIRQEIGNKLLKKTSFGPSVPLRKYAGKVVGVRPGSFQKSDSNCMSRLTDDGWVEYNTTNPTLADYIPPEGDKVAAVMKQTFRYGLGLAVVNAIVEDLQAKGKRTSLRSIVDFAARLSA
tara:strand:+ start:539 stop:2017 length:1479 start_codon:yes stop_codon:yes gene_type:complete